MKYAIKDIKENMVVTQMKGLPISLKDSLIISKFIKGKNTQKVKSYFHDVIELKKAIPYNKYCGGKGHRKGKMAAGRYPIKAVKYFLNLIKSGEANAITKNLDVNNLIISAIIPNKGNVGYHYGRRRGLKTKSVHIQLYLEESIKTKKDVEKENKELNESKKEKIKLKSNDKISSGKNLDVESVKTSNNDYSESESNESNGLNKSSDVKESADNTILKKSKKQKEVLKND